MARKVNAFNPVALYASAAVFGTGLDGDYMIIPWIAAEIFSEPMLGRLLGVILIAGEYPKPFHPG